MNTTDLGRFVHSRRKELGLSQADVTARMSQAGAQIDRSSISHIESGRIVTPAPDVLNALAVALEVSPLLLLERTGYNVQVIQPQSEQLSVTVALLDDRRRVEIVLLAQALLRAQ
jgi:transcriptional regulator with XRE-family HTH domain